MIRFLILLFIVSLSGAASAQIADTTGKTTPEPQLAASVAAETRARDEAFAAWKVQYATNRAKIVQEIKVVRSELTAIDPAKAELKQTLTTLLNGTVRRWNEEKMDFADPDQFAECQALFGTIRRAMREGVLKQ